VGKYVHHNRETEKIGFCTSLKSKIYFRSVSKQQASSRPRFRAVRNVLWKMEKKNCAHNRSRPDEIDTETEMCTSLKSELSFRFRWPPTTKSTLISYISVGVFVTIRGKICPPQSRNCQNRFLHISKIGNLLPVCLRNNIVRNNHISERHAKFGENR